MRSSAPAVSWRLLLGGDRGALLRPLLAVPGGALLLVNSGICCTDEFGGMPEANRNVLREMMEQQTLGIARRALSASCSPAPSCQPSPAGESEVEQEQDDQREHQAAGHSPV